MNKIYLKKISGILLSTFIFSLTGTFVPGGYTFAKGPGDVNSSEDEDEEVFQTSSSTIQIDSSERVALPSIDSLLNGMPTFELTSLLQQTPTIPTTTMNNLNDMQFPNQFQFAPAQMPFMDISITNGMQAQNQFQFTPVQMPYINVSITNNIQLQDQQLYDHEVNFPPTVNRKFNKGRNKNKKLHLPRKDTYGKGEEARKTKEYLKNFDAKNSQAMRVLNVYFKNRVKSSGLLLKSDLFEIINSVNNYLKLHIGPNASLPKIPRCAKRSVCLLVKYVDDNLELIAPILPLINFNDVFPDFYTF